MSEADDTRKALDAALERRLQGFGTAARKTGIKTQVYARPTANDRWSSNLKSFSAKVVTGVALIAAAWGMQGTAHKAAEKFMGNQDTEVSQKQLEIQQAAQEVLKQMAEVKRPAWDSDTLRDVKSRLNYVEVTVGKKTHTVLDIPSRIMLVKAVSKEINLEGHHLDWKDLYGLIHAETGWVERDGMGNNKVTSSGLAQMEPDTAVSIGINDPRDPVQAVWGAGYLMTQAADWSYSKVHRAIKHAKLHKSHERTAFKEGISIYYNTSTALRNRWTVKNTSDFPIETQRHIDNSQDGKVAASYLEKKMLRTVSYLGGKSFPNATVSDDPSLSDAQNTEIQKNRLNENLQSTARIELAKNLQTGVDYPCEVSVVSVQGKPDVIHSVCKNDGFFQSGTRKGDVKDLGTLGQIIEIGKTNGVPVYMASNSNVVFGAVIMNRDKPFVVIQDSLAEKFRKDIPDATQRSQAISFVIGHEIGHLAALKHVSESRTNYLMSGDATAHDVNENECAADNESIKFLMDKGLSMERALDTAHQALTTTNRFIVETTGSNQTNDMFHHRIQNLEEHSSGHNHQHSQTMRF